MNRKRLFHVTGLAALSFLISSAPAQVGSGSGSRPEPEATVIVPQVRAHRRLPAAEVRVESVRADISIEDQLAFTSLAITLWNPGSGPREAQVLLPVPDGVTVRSMQYDGAGVEPSARLLPRDEARRIYDSIVHRKRDPALLEFAGFNLVRTSAFPVPPRARQRVVITYEQVLERDGSRIDYSLPRSQSLEPLGASWEATVRIRNSSEIAAVYSPSHSLVVDQKSPRQATVDLTDRALSEPGALRLSVVLQEQNAPGFWSSVFVCPDLDGAPGKGYFMLLAGAPSGGAPSGTAREVVLVFDRSGSMRGPKIEQARAAALQVIEGLREGECFNIIDYSDSVASFAPEPVRKDARTTREAREYIRLLAAGGGTNIRDALLEALRPTPAKELLTMVLFLTDGLPTVGERSELRIREAVEKANVHGRRIFAFGIGLDVNAPLLTSVSRAARGASTFVLPEEDVEAKVSQVFRRLDGPVICAPTIHAVAADGSPDTRFLRDVVPAQLPDFFSGDQILILGRWEGTEPHRVVIRSSDSEGSFSFDINPQSASLRHAHVARLWATRRIAGLLDDVHAMGASGPESARDPRFKELVDQILALSTRYGVLTEYTAFLATEPGLHGDHPAELSVPMTEAPAHARNELAKKSFEARTGAEGVAQQRNVNAQREVRRASAKQAYIAADMKEREIGGVQPVADRTLFYRAGRWVEHSLLDEEAAAPERTVEFGTPEFSEVVNQLVTEGRQGLLARGGEVYLRLQGKRVLVRCP